MVDQKSGKSGRATEATGQRENPVNQGSQSDGPSPFAAPSISLPKGGGAIRGMGEKFAANPVTGTGSMSIPIAVSPGRAGFGPQLSLSYDSGAGNGPFGLGWNLSLPAITRKTDKGLPKYQDADESDVFILSGAEDLVPVFRKNDAGEWIFDQNGKHVFLEDPREGFLVRQYRPRIEGLFARIERWTDTLSGETHWRSITKDNITTWYGKSDKSRIADPADTSKVFTWLICESYDDKGNAILYQYKPENSIKEDSTRLDNAHVNEKNRTDSTRKTNRYLKCINYCNQTPRQQDEDLTQRTDWLMEVFFDYGDEHYIELPENAEKRIFVTASLNPTNLDPANSNPWPVRTDPFSTYRSGFEIRTYRLCQRVMMFHCFAELGATPYLVRSTEFKYKPTPISSFITSVTQSGYVRQNDGTYLKKSLPPVEFTYSEAKIEDKVRELDAESLENLPTGLDGSNYQWIDLDGDGVAGILTEQANAWFYKRNLSPKNIVLEEDDVAHTVAKFAPVETVAVQPSFRGISGGGTQFLDLAGDGRPDLVQFDGPAPGFYEHEEDDRWTPHRPFASLPNLNWRDPNLKFVDLTGDGHTDILISEDDVFTWYPSLAEAGFGASERTRQPFDEEKGPRLVFADGTQSIFLADFSGDGLTDIVRIRNGEVCYWPNLGYGRFGAKVTMDGSPWFDRSDQFDQRRIRLADIDGSGVTDIIYLHGDGIHLYFNQSGNSWSKATPLDVFPRTDNLSSVTVTDLLGNGTACLVWSSPLPGEARRPMRYVDLMGGQKPHLMITSKNNLGAETRVHYAPSTKFYLQDKYDSKPWITRLPFPVHVVERVETFDHISRNHFVTRYAYHHGYFDGEEREFRGFGMVEQWDTDEFDKLDPTAANVDASWHMPPVHTKTWFHTGAYFRGQEISRHLAHEYFGAPLDKTQFERWLNDALLPDTVFPEAALSADETREACRAIKGAMLRQELYADDGSARKGIPYTVTEQNFTIKHLQPRAGNRHAVFFTHPREAISYHYERSLNDPRVTHAMTLEVDPFGNVLRSAAIGYRRNALPGVSAPEQQQTHITLSANRFANHPNEADWYRIGLPVEARAFEVVKPPEPRIINNQVKPFSFVTMRTLATTLFPPNSLEPEAIKLWPYEKWDWRANATNAPPDVRLRSIEHVRTLYREDDLTALLPLGDVESLALPGESYKLALTPSLLSQVFRRKRLGQPDENLLPTPAGLLEGKGADEGGYVLMDGNWWIPSGRIFFDSAANIANPNLTAARELTTARQQFFLPQKFADPFGQSATAGYDAHHLLVIRTRDAVGNTVDAANDYRVLQPRLVTDPNGNRTGACFDALGMVAATAVMGKDGQNIGDKLDGVEADLSQTRIDAFVAQPRRPSANPAESEVTQIVHDLLQNATTRIVYDLDRFSRLGKPPFAATIAREKHVSDLATGERSKLQVSFSYSDGFGREIQKKIQAEPGPLVAGRPEVNPRWVGSGWTIFNNKGKPVRQYEPFFDDTHNFKFARIAGVSPILFYDPLERVVATLHPNHTYEKVLFDPWRQVTWDVNDTVLSDPRTDADILGYTAGYFASLPASPPAPAWQTWHAQRQGGALGAREQSAASKAAAHADTPTTAHFDSIGRPFLTLADNGPNPAQPGQHLLFATRVELDLEGNQRAVKDAKGRVVMRYDYDMLGNRIHQSSMEAGERWMLNDAMGKPIRAWDSRGHAFRTEYDPLRRPLRSFVTGADPANPNQELLTERLVYGEQHPEDELRNLRGKLYLHLDQAGTVTNEAFDFKGNPLRATRRLGREYKKAINWSAVNAVLPANASAKLDPVALEAALAPLLEAETFTSRTTYDALNRPVQLIAPRSDQPGAKRNVIQPVYNEANLLEQVHVWLNHSTEPAGLLNAATVTPSPVGVNNIDYDAKGQRLRIEYKNGATTRYAYDPETFRLIHLYTRRGATFTEDCENPQPPPPTIAAPEASPLNKPCGLQNLHYTYDPAGNVTHIRDDAQQTVYFAGQVVSPYCDYTYDAIYRLITATGREHIGQVGQPETTWNDEFRVKRQHPHNGQAMRNYTEAYEYDAVGNLEKLIHHAANGSWTRTYAYDEDSLTEPATLTQLAKKSNRLSSTTIGNGAPEPYSYDAHGNMTRMNHLPLMQWDYRDQLQATAQQVINNGVPETTWYVYDAGGQRVRKVTETAVTAQDTANGIKPKRKKERIYLGGFEIYREYKNDGASIELERETLHIMDDKQRIALVETKTKDVNVPANTLPETLTRYQFGNHLGSACLELDHQAQIISYEEYTPYGSTSYQAVRSQTETPKRYRYTGMERDEESGLGYHGARYYAAWLGRWASCEPYVLSEFNKASSENAEREITANNLLKASLYSYCFCNPAKFIDPDGNLPWFEVPSDYNSVSSKFGPRTHPITGVIKTHGGIDLPMPEGTRVRSMADGVVKSIAWQKVPLKDKDGNIEYDGDGNPKYTGGGLYVEIDHGKGLSTFYMHLTLDNNYEQVSSGVLVSKGERVKEGQVIALSGNTGGSTGPHLHLEILLNGNRLDPMTVGDLQSAIRNGLRSTDLFAEKGQSLDERILLNPKNGSPLKEASPKKLTKQELESLRSVLRIELAIMFDELDSIMTGQESRPLHLTKALRAELTNMFDELDLEKVGKSDELSIAIQSLTKAEASRDFQPR